MIMMCYCALMWPKEIRSASSSMALFRLASFVVVRLFRAVVSAICVCSVFYTHYVAFVLLCYLATIEIAKFGGMLARSHFLVPTLPSYIDPT